MNESWWVFVEKMSEVATHKDILALVMFVFLACGCQTMPPGSTTQELLVTFEMRQFSDVVPRIGTKPQEAAKEAAKAPKPGAPKPAAPKVRTLSCSNRRELDITPAAVPP